MTLLHDAEITAEWKTLPGTVGFTFSVAPDGRIAFLRVQGKTLAAVLLEPNSPIRYEPTPDGRAVVFRNLSGANGGKRTVEVPICRVLGEIQHAIVPGVELLEKGEWSSSKLDLVTPDHKRIRPLPQHLTQQWMGAASEFGTLRLQWREPKLQPTFAVPNYFDGTPDLRMSLELPPGEEVRLYADASTRVTDLYAQGTSEQMQNFHRLATTPADVPTETLFGWYRKTMETDVLYTDGVGWKHCAGTHWGPAPSAGQASSLWLVGGDVPKLARFHDYGTHIENEKIYFLRGMAQQKQNNWINAADRALRGQKEDGSYVSDGPYVRGHFENTALGVCLIPVRALLNGYLATHEEKYLTAALKTLNYSRRFQVARGAQSWEMPLHTPDPLAAAHAIRVYTKAYQITKDSAWLEDARRWALEGLTYVYWWDTPEQPLQFGATIGVLGATNWAAPLWIGRPVQWIGTVYAYSLLELSDVLAKIPASAEESAKWRQVAEAITQSAERQVYPDGPSQGLLPDSFDTFSEARFPWDINPSALISLRLRLSGTQDGVQFFWNDKHRVASPFPAVLTDEGVTIHAPDGLEFQILLDGNPVDVPKEHKVPF